MCGHGSTVNALGLAEMDGRHLVLTGGGDNRVRLWDLEDQQQVDDPLIGHVEQVTAISVIEALGRQLVVTGSEDGTLGLWDLRTRRQVGEPLAAHPAYPGVLALAARVVDGAPVAVSCGRAIVRVWNLEAGQQIGQKLTGHYGNVNAVALGTIDRTPVAITGGDDGRARIWDLTADRPLAGHTGAAHSAAIARIDERCLAVTGGEDTTAVVWDLDADAPTQDGPALAGHRATVTSVALGELAGRPVVVTGSRDGTTRLWDMTTRRLLGPPLAGHTGPVTALALFATIDGSALLATGSADGTVRLWDPHRQQQLIPALTGHNADVDQLACCQINGDPLIMAATVHGPTSAWRARDGQPVPLRRLPSDRWYTLAVGDVDGRPAVLARGTGNVLQLWDPLAGKPIIERMAGHADVVIRAVLGQRNGLPTAVTADNRGNVLLWDLHNGQLLGTPLNSDQIMALALGPRGIDTAVITAGQQTRLWSVATFRQHGDALTGRDTDTVTLALGTVAGPRGDGTLIAYTAHREGRINAWDPMTGTRLDSAAVPPADRWVNVLAAGEMYGRQVLAAAGSDGVIRLWSLSGKRTVAEMHIETAPQDLLLTSDGYVCIATVMGVVALHVPDWGTGDTG